MKVDIMNKTSMGLRLRINNCRAVHCADIQLDGLTIVCGSNGVGKSTIARILQDSIEVQLYYVGSLRMGVWNDFSVFVSIPLQEYLLSIGLKLPGENTITKDFDFFTDRRLDLASWEAHYDAVEKLLQKVVSSTEWRNASVTSRAFLQLCSRLDTSEQSVTAVESALFKKLESAREEMRLAGSSQIEHESFSKSISSVVLWEGEVWLYENEEVVWHYLDKSSKENSKLESVKNVFYIESPIVSIPKYEKGCLKFEGNLCGFTLGGEHIPLKDDNALLADFMRLTSGRVALGKDQFGNPQWRFVRSDKLEFPLSMCASGFKSFAILSTLYKYNYLNKESVLIIDEPEAHLHPAWIVEYAAVLVRLVKDFGVRVLVASHNPDMVQALKALALASEIGPITKIYQAKEAEDNAPFQFDYHNTELSIGKIFDSFNQVYDMIERTAEQIKSKESRDA